MPKSQIKTNLQCQSNNVGDSSYCFVMISLKTKISNLSAFSIFRFFAVFQRAVRLFCSSFLCFLFLFLGHLHILDEMMSD